MLNLFYSSDKIEAGCDEVGRGCLAGPVVAAAVILPKSCEIDGLTDSKKLSESQRIKLEPEIKKLALAWAVAEVSPAEIDAINILQATYKAMHLAVKKLKTKPELLLIDGNRFKPFKDVPHVCIIKGDSQYLSIAAASVLAKNYRDKLMKDLHQLYPNYGWIKNVGYPTVEHRTGIEKFGVTPYHRLSFQLLKKQLDLFD
ncbi:MAG: ribonuclease HII [Chryseotalea sp.]